MLSHNFMISLYKKHISYRPKPRNLTEEDVSIFEKDFSKVIPAAHYRILHNAYILNDSLFSIRNFRFYTRYTRVYDKKQKLKTNIKRLLYLTKPVKKIEKAVWIVDTKFGFNYFHWLLDSMSRYVAVKDLIDTHIVVLPDELKKPRHVADSLRLLNIPFEFYSTNSNKIKIKELLLPGFVTDPSSYYNREYVNKIRRLFLSGREGIPGRKIYFSRKKIGFRLILNEDEIIDIMTSFGYEVHYPEKYTIAEQIELMSNTISVIGQHGAALTNMLFMQENGFILELRDENWNYDNCFYSLASDLNHNYLYQIDLGDNKDKVQHANTVVDPIRFKKNLELIEELIKSQ